MRPGTLIALLCSANTLFGQAYFQQQVDHRIDVRLDDVGHFLHAHETFTYTNNSTTALDTIWIHLWPNAYREKHTALSDQLATNGDLDLHFATEQERGWIDSLDFRTDDVPLSWGIHSQHIDIGWIKLRAPLAPGGTTSISTPFRVKIPDGKFSRLGHTGQAYYITQWYPKPAVFDANGWHAMPYLGNGEFYSEFGTFDVTITLPDNYTVGATGNLQNVDERERMNRLAEDIAPSEKSNDFPISSAKTKALHYTQDRVHDFAWFADKRFIVRKSEVALPADGKTVTTWALYTPKNAELWSDAVSYVNESVKFYSQWVGDYPYDACTAVDGTISAGGGMEYPMITVIGNMSDKMGLDNVIAHEVGHNWFYGILGSNERDHAWMDEGMNSFVELLYMRKRYPSGRFSIGLPGLKKLTRGTSDAHRLQSELGYRLNARRNLDQPLSLTSRAFTETNYGTMVYMKTALIMDHLMAYLGEEIMDRCLQAYFEEWKFKHPQPEDMRAVFERVSAKDLGWVFDGLLGTTRKVDVKAASLKGGTLTFRSTATGEFPFPISAWNGPDSLGTIWSTGTKWTLRHSHQHLELSKNAHITRGSVKLPWPNADRIVIDANNRTLDIDRRNNEVRSYGLFKRCKAPRFEWLAGLERNDRRSVYYALLPAFNGNDGFQLGAALRNTTFPSQRTEWVVAPLYGFASERWGGAGRIEHHFDRMRSRVFQNINVGVSVRSASEFRDHDALAWYNKVSPYINFDLKRDPLAKPWHHNIGVRGVYLNNGRSFKATDGNTYAGSAENYYSELTYRAEDERKLHRSLIASTITQHADFLRASLELQQAFALNDHGDELRLRAFAGSFFWKRNDRPYNGLAAWGLSWGTEDLLYDHAYLERNARDAFFARQYNPQQGAFKTPFLQGGSDTWIGSINAELDLPIPLPIAVFASAGMVPITKVTQEGRSTSTATYFEGGIGIIAIRDVLELWVPLIVSQRIADEEEFLDRTVTDRIRFIFSLQKLDPTRALRNLNP